MTDQLLAQQDARYMRAALMLSRRGLGQVWPNPSVGALIVTDIQGGQGAVVGRGVTCAPGKAHAEVSALAQAGDKARGATCYVTLEPCSHYGRTPPCALALAEAGVARVVIGMRDPNPRVAGRGEHMLRQAGIEVVSGVEEAACRAVQAGFVRRMTENRPYTLLKMAVSRDGFIGRREAGQVRISGDLAKNYVHGLRSTYDAILIGIGTALSDDPELTCRLPGMEGRSPVRIVVDSKARLPVTSRLVQGAADVPVWLVCSAEADTDRIRVLQEAGVLVIRVPAIEEGIAPLAVVSALSMRGITRLMVEGGSHIAASFIKAGLVDELSLITGKSCIGGSDAIPALAGLDLGRLRQEIADRLAYAGPLGEDWLENFILNEGVNVHRHCN